MAKSILSACGIYSIRNTLNNKQYIGSSVNIRRRWSAHRKCLSDGAHHSTKLQRAWDKYGEGAFEWIVLEYIPDMPGKPYVMSREQHWIDSADSVANGYNALPVAGSSMGSKRTATTRARMSEAAKRRGVDEKTIAALVAAGRNPSAETRQKMSASQKGKTASAETRAKMSAAQKLVERGPLSDEARVKMRIAHLGKRLTDEQKAKISKALIGKTVSLETRAKMSKPRSQEARANMARAQIGKKHSPESRAKMSIAAKNRRRTKQPTEGQLWLTLPTGDSLPQT